MLGILYSAASIGGYIVACNRFLKIPFQFSPFFSVSLISIILFLFAITDTLPMGSILVAYLGCTLGLLSFAFKIFSQKTSTENRGSAFPAIFLIILTGLGFFYAQDMMFSVIDDYVYWGIFGKYLFTTGHLPDSQTSIIARHLAYTPGSGLFQYLGYYLFSGYSEHTSYFFQNIIFIAALFTLSSPNKPKESIFIVLLTLSLSILMSGSVLAKLSVDFLLSAYFCAVLWIVHSPTKLQIKLLSISTPLICLFLFKEIGLFLCFSLLFATAFHIHNEGKSSRQNKILALATLAVIGFLALSIKYLWQKHCTTMGFGQFSSAVNTNSILDSLKIFTDPQRLKGAKLFFHSITLGPADRLKIPYVIWYAFLYFMWKKIHTSPQVNKPQLTATIVSISFFFSLYLLLLYFLQIIVFNIGGSSDHAIGMTRYVNIYLSGFILFTICLFFKTSIFPTRLKNHWVFLIILISSILLALSRSQRLVPEKSDLEIKSAAAKISEIISISPDTKICVSPNSDQDDLAGIKLLYYLLPARINTVPFEAPNFKSFQSGLSSYDFCLFYKAEQQTINWLKILTDTDSPADGFYRITTKPKQLPDRQTLSIGLEKLF